MEAEAQEVSTESAQTNGASQPEQAAEATQETQASNDDGKPAGYDPIDEATATPQQVKERIDYLYRQLKDDKRTLSEYRRVAQQQSQQLAELTNGMGTVVHHLQDKNFADNEAQLAMMRQQAWEKGDSKAYDEINDRLIEIKLNKKLTATQRQVVQPQQQQNQQPQYNNAAEIAQRGVQEGELDVNDARLIAAWQDERDETGNQLRPWAFSNSPLHMQAAAEAAAVWRNPRFATTEQKIAEVDRRMGVAKRTVSPTVMGANLTNRGKSNKVTLTPKQQEIALRMGGSKKSDTEKLDWYRKQVEKVKSTKGARQ